ncbi:MAG: rhomboid family intramembrane serine protease [Bacteroidales bacterium]|nr:rhomboid family intramembrane serine protease [Bacteroidales bacterium]
MFGNAIENYWGAKKFLIYYFVTGIGAGLIHYVVLYFQIQPELATINQFIDAPSIDNFSQIVSNHKFVYYQNSPEMIALKDAWTHVVASPDSQRALNDLAGLMVDYREYYLNAHNIVGASGAVFGLLLAFGMLFPNAQIYIYFLLPIKAKWFVILYGALELVYGVTGSQDGVAHFAHLGGMLFGILLILLWRKKERREQGYTDFYEY